MRRVARGQKKYTWWERLRVKTGLSTNVLFPSLCATLFAGALAGGSSAVSAVVAAARGEDVSLWLPLASAAVSFSCLAVIGYGLALAPNPQPSDRDSSSSSSDTDSSGHCGGGGSGDISSMQ